MKMFAAYQRILCGRLCYETFKSNAEHALPSLRSIDRYISQYKSPIKEGVLRADELHRYLTDLNVPKFVSLSEDATRIENRIQYETGTNQLIGFVLPLNPQNGMPTPNVYLATSAARMESCFYNVETSEERKRSSFVNVVMAQPLKKSIPPFCILLFGTDSMYKSDDISKRWEHITAELRKRGIQVVSFASDSDPKFNSAMRRKFNLGRREDTTSPIPNWYNADLNVGYVTVQDTVHIGTKFRNRMLNRRMKIGDYTISTDHLAAIMKSIPKTEHNLCGSTIAPIDRQNFASVLRICDRKVIDLLQNIIEESKGTVLYLKLLDNILRSFLDIALSPERIRLIWFSNFVLRIWKDFIKSHDTYTLKEHFITFNCYSCVEINAHSLVALILFLRERKLEHLFHPEMLGSQQCEHIFRQIRSMSSTYSTVTNCSLLEIMQRMSKIELQNDISHIKLKEFNFPRIGISSSSFYPTVDRNGQDRYGFTFQLPDLNEIIREIELAKNEAFEYVESLGIKSTTSLICELPILKSKPAHIISSNCENNIEIDDDFLKLFSAIHLKQYAQKSASTESDHKKHLVKVRTDNCDPIFIPKHTLCWIFGKSTNKLSSDRLRRVMSQRI